MSVCLFVNFFSVKDFSATTWLRILKFGTKLDSDELYWVTKKKQHSYILLISSFICSIFFLSNENFCHRFLSSYWSQCFQILCTPSGRQSVLCKWKSRCLFSFCLLFSNFKFFLLSLLYNTYGHFFSVKDFSLTTWLRILKFGTKLDSDELFCVTQKTATYCLSVPSFVHFFFLSNKNFCHRFLSSYWSQCFQILCTLSGG